MEKKTRYKYPENKTLRGACRGYEARGLFDYWYEEFKEHFYNGRKIVASDMPVPFSGEMMYTSVRGYAELMSYVCIYLLENSLGEISLTFTRKGREIHLCVLSKTRREGILNPITTFDEYAEATGEEDRRIANAFRCAYRAYAQLCYSRNAYGDEYFDIAFNCADIGTLGFKARDIHDALVEGIAFARICLNIDRLPREDDVNPASDGQDGAVE
jgi:hypothetical protein